VRPLACTHLSPLDLTPKTRQSYPDRVYGGPLRKLLLADNLLGEKTKKGFYDHSSGKPQPWDGLEAVLAKARAEAGVAQVHCRDIIVMKSEREKETESVFATGRAERFGHCAGCHPAGGERGLPRGR
jgi:hypothetical protein